jgi:polyisoprenoid-binding protein YceI
MKILQLLAGLTVVGMSSKVCSDPVPYAVDKWHTRIFFSVNHMGLSNYRGRFIDYDIEFLYDVDDISASKVEAFIPVSGIDTFSRELNEKMSSDLFFASDRHPTIHFRSNKIEKLADDSATMSGELTMKGVTLPITLDVTVNKDVLHPRFDLMNVGFSAHGELDSSAFGVNRLPDWMVGPIVQVQIELEAFEGERVPYYAE